MGLSKNSLLTTLPYQTRDLCSMRHRTTDGQDKTAVGVLYFVLEENRHLA